MARVLGVDDLALQRKLVKVVLEHAGHEVALAASAWEADQRLAQGGIDLVVMDMLLPAEDGAHYAERLRADPDFAQVPIVAITAYPGTFDAARAQEAGCDAYLTKPFWAEELTGIVGRLAARGA